MENYKKTIKKMSHEELETVRRGFHTFKRIFMNNKKFYEYTNEETFIFSFLCILSEETIRRINEE